MEKLNIKPILTEDFQKGLRTEFMTQNEILEKKFEDELHEDFNYLGPLMKNSFSDVFLNQQDMFKNEFEQLNYERMIKIEEEIAHIIFDQHQKNIYSKDHEKLYLRRGK